MKILLVYHQVPEDLDVYMLDVSEVDGERILKCRDQYGNSVGLSKQSEDVQEAVDWLGDRILKDEMWKDKKVDLLHPDRLDDYELVVTGWML